MRGFLPSSFTFFASGKLLDNPQDRFLWLDVRDCVRAAMAEHEQRHRRGRFGVVAGGLPRQLHLRDQLDGARRAHDGAPHSHPQLEYPRLLNGEHEPQQDPQEEVGDAHDDGRQGGAVEGAAVHHGEVVQEGRDGNGAAQEHAQRCAVRECVPAGRRAPAARGHRRAGAARAAGLGARR